MDLYFQGMAWLNKGPTPDNVGRKRVASSNARCRSIQTMSTRSSDRRTRTWSQGASAFVTDPVAAFAAAEAKLTKALSWVPDHALGHMTLGFVYIFTKRAAPGIAECEHALELDRNLASAHAFIGLGKIFIGRAEETEAHIGEAPRLSPRDTMPMPGRLSRAPRRSILGSYEQAAAWFQRAIEANRNYPTPYFLSAAALAQLGRLDDANSAVKAGLALNPTFAISRARAAWTAMSDDPTYLAQLEPILEGMRKAGVPEQ